MNIPKETIEQIKFYSKSGDFNNYQIANRKYLLNQILRQIKLPIEKYYISINALNLWKEMFGGPIMDYWYNKKIKALVDGNITRFVGAKKDGSYGSISSGSSVEYRSVFHDDHIIPISKLVDELMNSDNLTDELICSVVNKISVCRMLKVEDRSVPRLKGRETEEQVINVIYRNKGIEVLKMVDVNFEK
ncbi:hypothetical protein [Haploplasma axanthum]|nr:hypothetical protein [Haploplasma axanthum]